MWGEGGKGVLTQVLASREPVYEHVSLYTVGFPALRTSEISGENIQEKVRLTRSRRG